MEITFSCTSTTPKHGECFSFLHENTSAAVFPSCLADGKDLENIRKYGGKVKQDKIDRILGKCCVYNMETNNQVNMVILL